MNLLFYFWNATLCLLLCLQAGWAMTFWVCYEQVRKQTGTSAFWPTHLCANFSTLPKPSTGISDLVYTGISTLAFSFSAGSWGFLSSLVTGLLTKNLAIVNENLMFCFAGSLVFGVLVVIWRDPQNYWHIFLLTLNTNYDKWREKY